MAAWVAVVGSVFLHVTVIQQAPPLALGRVPGFDEVRRIRPVVLGDVRRDVVSALDRPERFRAEAPDQQAMERLAADALRETLDAWSPHSLPEMAVALAGDDRAVAVPEPEMERAAWDARQELLQIRDRVVPDEVSALPRRLIPDAERTPTAPDITLETSTPGTQLAVRGAGWMQAEASRTGRPAIPDTAEPMQLTPVDALDADHESRADIEGIEDLLALSMVSYVDPAEPDHRFFRVDITRRGADALPVLPKDVLLIQDASASMTQRTLDRAKEGLHYWVSNLNEGDQLDVIAFRHNVERAFGELTPVSPVMRSQAAFFVESMRARGDTDVFASLEALLAMEPDPHRPLIAVMISDGVPTTGVVDSTEIIARFSYANDGRISVFNAGGGPRVNMYLLDFLSYKNRGDAFMGETRDDLPRGLQRLAQELSRPVLTALDWRLAGAPAVEMYPQRLTHLYLDRPLVIYGRAPLDQERAVIRIQGQTRGEMKDMVFQLNFPEAGQGGAYLRSEWAWQKVYHLVGEHIRTRSPDVLAEIRRMADRYQIPVLYGTDRVPLGFDRRFHFHGRRQETFPGER